MDKTEYIQSFDMRTIKERQPDGRLVDMVELRIIGRPDPQRPETTQSPNYRTTPENAAGFVNGLASLLESLRNPPPAKMN